MILSVSFTSYVGADEFSDSMYIKGGVVYPHTGDSTQTLFKTPTNITDFLKPGMFLGVLPKDCLSASHGEIGDYYICPHDLALKPEIRGGKPAYKVIEAN